VILENCLSCNARSISASPTLEGRLSALFDFSKRSGPWLDRERVKGPLRVLATAAQGSSKFTDRRTKGEAGRAKGYVVDNPPFNRATCSTRLSVSTWSSLIPQASETRKPCRNIRSNKHRSRTSFLLPLAASIESSERVPNLRHYPQSVMGRLQQPFTASSRPGLLGGPHDRWRVPLSDQHMGERTIDLCYSVYEASLFCAQPHTDPDHLRGAIVLPAINDGVLRIVELGPAYMT
jgi:hypothetical protein